MEYQYGEAHECCEKRRIAEGLEIIATIEKDTNVTIVVLSVRVDFEEKDDAKTMSLRCEGANQYAAKEKRAFNLLTSGYSLSLEALPKPINFGTLF